MYGNHCVITKLVTPINYQLQSRKTTRLIASIHPSICLQALSCLNRLTFDLDFWHEVRPLPWLHWDCRASLQGQGQMVINCVLTSHLGAFNLLQHQWARSKVKAKVIFEPTCAHARWTLMHLMLLCIARKKFISQEPLDIGSNVKVIGQRSRSQGKKKRDFQRFYIVYLTCGIEVKGHKGQAQRSRSSRSKVKAMGQRLRSTCKKCVLRTLHSAFDT